MNSPKISVIVPVYNTEKYLHICIESILSQTFTDFELLLINDGSKDTVKYVTNMLHATVVCASFTKRMGGVV